MRVLLIRHGQSEGNVNHRIQGPDDTLTDLGRHQAELLGPFLQANYAIDRFVVSTHLRARETADIINRSVHKPMDFDPRIVEIHPGHATGVLWDDWRDQNPEKAAVWGWDVRHADAGWEGGESGRDLATRSFTAWDEMVEKYRSTDKTIGMVTHGGVIAWLMARFNEDDLDYWPGPYAEIANCSITDIGIAPSGFASVMNWNITTHLGDAYAPHLSPVIPETRKSHSPS